MHGQPLVSGVYWLQSHSREFTIWMWLTQIMDMTVPGLKSQNIQKANSIETVYAYHVSVPVSKVYRMVTSITAFKFMLQCQGWFWAFGKLIAIWETYFDTRVRFVRGSKRRDTVIDMSATEDTASPAVNIHCRILENQGLNNDIDIDSLEIGLGKVYFVRSVSYQLDMRCLVNHECLAYISAAVTAKRKKPYPHVTGIIRIFLRF